MEILHDFVMAEVQARFAFREKEQDIPHPWEYYPKLFEKEAKRYAEKKAEDDLERYKEEKRLYAAEFNRRRKQQGL